MAKAQPTAFVEARGAGCAQTRSVALFLIIALPPN